MGLPKEMTLDEEFAEFADAAKAQPSDQELREARAYVRWKASMERHLAQVNRMQAYWNKMETKLSPLVSSLRKEIEAGKLSVDLDELIGYYSQYENSLKEIALPQIKLAQHHKRNQFSLPVSQADRAKSIAVWEKGIQVHVRALEAIRDLRWQLMALRSEVEPSGDAPVFDDPDEFLRYLDKAP